MSDKKPRVSVLMPNYNGEKYIAEAIESILNQTFSDFEFIIIDDGSTDASRDIIQSYAQKDTRIIAIKNEQNLKICKTLNKGIELAQGEYIARMDSDDISLPTRIEKQVSFLDSHPECVVVGAHMNIMSEKGVVHSQRKYHLDDTSIRKKIFRYSPFCHPVILVRSSALKKSGGYDPSLVYAEDYDLYFRLGQQGTFANLDECLINYRMFKNNSTTKKLNQMEQGTLLIRKKATREYGYVMSFADNVYYHLQYISMYLLPNNLKIQLFNAIRNN